MAIVSFDTAAFRLRFPEFADVQTNLLAMYFGEAGLYCDNSDASPVSDATQRAIFLSLLVAHLATVNGGGTGDVAPVGQVTSASQGGVTASFASSPMTGGLRDWFLQTQYGASYWFMTARYRSFRYMMT